MFKRLGAFIIRLLLSLRYRLSVNGLEVLKGKKGVLILPNHPAEVDPIIVGSLLWKDSPLRPVVLEKYYYLSGLHWIMKLMRSIPMPDMEFEIGPFKRRRVERAMQYTIDALRSGDNVLLYPSGRLMVSNLERLGGNSAVHAILQKFPDLDIVLIRTRGLYGSSFSKALTAGLSPDFAQALKNGIVTVLRNFIFFVPRREVLIEIESVPADFPRHKDVVAINRWLEGWYNKPDAEPLTLVSRSFWREDLPAVKESRSEEIDLSDVPPDILAKVVDKVSELSDVSKDKIKLEHKLGDDLGMDSLIASEMLLWLNETFAVTDIEMAEVTSVASIVRLAAGKQGASKSFDTFVVPDKWFSDFETRPGIEFPIASSIPEAFLRTCDRMGDAIAIADERSGVLTFKKLKLATLLLSRYFRGLSGDYVGVLFPASAGASLIVMALLLAKKIPVMLNWTAGRRNIEHAAIVTGLEVIITSEAFLDLVDTDLEFIEDKMLFVEDVRKSLAFTSKLGAALLASLPAASLCELLRLNSISPEKTAVVLFTSGSEAAPKGVPLSHKNILSNINASLDVLSIKTSDAFYGFLPPFHSFGLTVTVFLPLVVGAKVVYHPNPNESRKLGLGCEKWRISIIAGTPTFLKGIIRAGTKEQLSSLRVLVSGAEKAPEDLFRMVEDLGTSAIIIEGYGITECSPIVAGNRPNTVRKGVGQPLRGVEILIVHPDTLSPLVDGERGLILIRGENVFYGYLGGKPDPFIEVSGKRWYNSGDLGYLEDGCLIISGRLKRFIKIGGEMLSLGAIEEVLSTCWPEGDKGPVLGVVAREDETLKRPLIYLFASVPINLNEANDLLKDEGFPLLVRISEVFPIDVIPLLGSGKADFQKLQKQLTEGH